MIKKYTQFAFIVFINLIHTPIYASESQEYHPIQQIISGLNQSKVPTLTRPFLSLPFDVVTITKQITGNSYSGIFKVYRGIRKNPDLQYKMLRTFVPHFAEITSLSACTYFIAAIVPRLYKVYAPKLAEQHPILPKLTIASGAALASGLIVTPGERLKVCALNDIPWQIYDENGRFNLKWLLFTEKGRQKLKWLYVGKGLTMTSSFTHVSLFLYLNGKLSDWFYPDHKGPFTLKESVLTGTALAAIQATATYPLLTLRSRLQAERLKNKNSNITLIQYLKNMHIERSYASLYNGWTVRFVRGICICVFDSYWFNNLGHTNKK